MNTLVLEHEGGKRWVIECLPGTNINRVVIYWDLSIWFFFDGGEGDVRVDTAKGTFQRFAESVALHRPFQELEIELQDLCEWVVASIEAELKRAIPEERDFRTYE